VAAVASKDAATGVSGVFGDPNTSGSVAVHTDIAKDIAGGNAIDAVHATAVTVSGT
jgi:hypothetical protein